MYRTQASQVTRISCLYKVHKSPVMHFTHVEYAKKDDTTGMGWPAVCAVEVNEFPSFKMSI